MHTFKVSDVQNHFDSLYLKHIMLTTDALYIQIQSILLSGQNTQGIQRFCLLRRGGLFQTCSISGLQTSYILPTLKISEAQTQIYSFLSKADYVNNICIIHRDPVYYVKVCAIHKESKGFIHRCVNYIRNIFLNLYKIHRESNGFIHRCVDSIGNTYI